MERYCELGLGLILVSVLIPSVVIGQGFQPLSHTTSYKVINGHVYFDPITTTTPEPTFLETWLPFLAPMQSVNSDEVDEQIINSVSGPPPPDGPPYGGGSYQNGPSYGSGPNPYGQAYRGGGPGLNGGGIMSLPGFNPQQNAGLDLSQNNSPYLLNDDDNYISSGSVNVPQQINAGNSIQSVEGRPQAPQPAGTSGNNENKLPALTLEYRPEQPPSTGNRPVTNVHNYDFAPNNQLFYSGNPYPKPIVMQPQPQKYPYLYQMPQATTTEAPPFYQGFLDWFGYGTSTENPFASAFSGTPFQYPQFAEDRKSDIGEEITEEVDESEQVEEPKTNALVTADKAEGGSFPCPKLGLWQWNGEVCIAVGPVPAWGCKPNDLAQSGRLTICRNKIFFPLGVNQHEK